MKENRVLDVRFLNDKLCVKIAKTPPGDWRIYEHRIDSLLDHVRRELGKPALHDSYICILAGIRPTSLSQIRSGKIAAIPPDWFLHLHDLSGIPIAELRLVAAMLPEVPAHPNARKARKEHLVPELPDTPVGNFK